jgi:hypothetical protein
LRADDAAQQLVALGDQVRNAKTLQEKEEALAKLNAAIAKQRGEAAPPVTPLSSAAPVGSAVPVKQAPSRAPVILRPGSSSGADDVPFN